MLWKTGSKSWQGWDKSCMLDTMNREIISPNSVTQGKTLKPFKVEDHVTDGTGLKQMGWKRTWKKMMIRNGMDQEIQQQVGCALRRKVDTESISIWSLAQPTVLKTGAEAVAPTPWEQVTSSCVLIFLETQRRKWRKINPSAYSFFNPRWW